ncbi:MAG: sugar transferase [Candidatus Magasanikbacteria bacterium]|nr:sugar transferase [Candidatus Magasanikbacteria bacterium]
MKKFELTFAVLQVPIDFCAIALAGFTAYTLRFTEYMRAIRPILFNISWNKYWPVVFLVAIIWVIIIALAGLYSTAQTRKMARDLPRIIFACSTGFAGITIYVFFTLQKFDSRFLVLVGWLLAIIYVFVGRILVLGIKRLLFRAGIGLRRTVIIGTQTVAEAIKQALTKSTNAGFKLVGSFAHFDNGIISQIVALRPDEIIFTDPKANEDEAFRAIDFANDNNIAFKYSADLFATISSNMTVTTIAGVPIVELRRTRLTGWGRIFKRLFDIVGSLFLLILSSPIYLVISIIILLETGRPIFYKNERVGAYGKKFFTLKFRSMFQKDCTGAQFGKSGDDALKHEAELIEKNSVKEGPVYKIANDPRVTKFGRFIRKWSIDELPQFWNVFIGQMSLVGPRPHQPREVEKYEKHHKIVLAIKPGITGMAQISGRSDLSFEDEIKLDAFYIENWNLLIDLIILIKTPFVVFRRKGAW